MDQDKELLGYEGVEQPTGYLNEYIHFFVIEGDGLKTVPYHYHSFHKSVLVLKGKLLYTIEGREHNLSVGDAIFVPKNKVHKLEVEPGGYRRMIVYFSDRLVDLVQTQNTPIDQVLSGMGKEYPYVLKGEPGTKVQLEPIEKALLTKGNDFGQDSLRLLKYMEWLIKAIKIMSDQLASGDIEPVEYQHRQIRQAMDYIREHLNNDLSVDKIASEIFISKYYLMKQFKESVGTSLHQYILKERITKARELMLVDIPLTQIAYDVGFKDYSTFLRAFKRQYGYSPREFMKLLPTKP